MASMAQKHGALAFIFIRRDEPRNKRAFAVTPEQVDMLYRKKDGKSISWKWFEENAWELKRLATPVRWDITTLLEEYI